MNLSKLFLPLFPLFFIISSAALAELTVDYVEYEDNVYSKAKKTELGDEIELEMALKYSFNEQTAARFRFQTRPEDNREVNKTDRFELGISHSMDQLDLYLDLEILTNDGSKGGTALSFDLDSDYTFIRWQKSDSFAISFYPFNFDGEVGEEFDTWDVTRIYHLDGVEPGNTIDESTNSDITIVNKTIPGIVFDYSMNENLQMYAGVGIASYVYPVDADYDITAKTSITRLERKEDIGYKFGFSYKNDSSIHSFKYVGHSEAEETGALLKEAASIYSLNKLSGYIIEGEVTYSKAGKSPWEVNSSTSFFAQKTPLYAPVYANYNGDALQDWVGKSDFAFGLKLGVDLDTSVPYLFYRHHGKHFIYNDDESAHELRTNDLNKSHGGLDRFGVGSFFRYGRNLVINPEIEYMSAQNAVFANSSDVRKDKYYGTYKKNDLQITLTVNYDLDGSSIFEL